MNKRFDGVMTALATPFSNGEVDEASFIKLIRQQLAGGVNGFVIGGTTGEGPTLSEDELHRLFDICRSECGDRATVVIGTGTNSTAATIEKTKKAEKWGADGALVVVPYYNRPPQRGLIAHFQAVARAAKIPIIIYNVPSRTSCSIDPDSVAAAAREDGICGIKDATGDMETLEKLKTISKTAFCLLSGDDVTGIEFCRRGGQGIISVVSHLIPDALTKFVAAARTGSAAAVRDYEKFGELLKFLYVEANPIPLKWALKEMGIFKSAELRLPLVEMNMAHAEGFRACLKKLELV